MGATMRSTVRKAARFAVYDEIKIKEKNHQTPPEQMQPLVLPVVMMKMEKIGSLGAEGELVILFMDRATSNFPKFIKTKV